VQKSVSVSAIAQISCAKQNSAPLEPLAHFKCDFFKIPVSSLYEATENELQGSGMAILEKIEQGT
jgi:hypothetical protein